MSRSPESKRMRARRRRAISRELVCVMKRRVDGGHRRRGGAGGIFELAGRDRERRERREEALQLPHTTVAVSLLHPFYHTCVFPPEDSIAQ